MSKETKERDTYMSWEPNPLGYDPSICDYNYPYAFANDDKYYAPQKLRQVVYHVFGEFKPLTVGKAVYLLSFNKRIKRWEISDIMKGQHHDNLYLFYVYLKNNNKNKLEDIIYFMNKTEKDKEYAKTHHRFPVISMDSLLESMV